MKQWLKKDIENKNFHNAKNNLKTFWSYIRSRLKTRTEKEDLIILKEDAITNTDQEKAEVLADLINRVYTKEADTEKGR